MTLVALKKLFRVEFWLTQIAQMVCREIQQAAFVSQRLYLKVIVVRLRNQQDLRETLCFRLCGLIEYACMLFSRRWRRSRRRMQQSCIISQRKTGWDGLCVFGVWGSSAEICGRHWRFFCAD